MRGQQALNTTYLSNAGNAGAVGYQTALQVAGDFAVVNDGTTEARTATRRSPSSRTARSPSRNAGTIFGGASATAPRSRPRPSRSPARSPTTVLTVTAVGSGTVVKGAIDLRHRHPDQPGPEGRSAAHRHPRRHRHLPLNVGGADGRGRATISGTYGTLTIGTATGTFAIGDVLTGSERGRGHHHHREHHRDRRHAAARWWSTTTPWSRRPPSRRASRSRRSSSRARPGSGRVVKISSTTDAAATDRPPPHHQLDLRNRQE
jgi:hypothetical protein